MSSSSQLSCTFLDPTSRSCAFRNLTGCHWLKLGCTSARTSGALPRRWDCLRTRYGSTTAPSGRHLPFPLIYGNGGCSSARSCLSAAAAAHACDLSVCGGHLVPQTQPGPPDHGRIVPTSRHNAFAVVPEKFNNTATHSHFWTAGVDSNEAERKRGTKTKHAITAAHAATSRCTGHH